MQKRGSGLALMVYEYLKEMILTMQLMPGEKVPESKIAEHFGISRTPIREAMRKLENDGLVKIFPNRFAQIVTLSTDYVQQLGIVRLELEKLAVQLAIFYGCNADFAKLRTVADRCYEAACRKDLQQQIRVDTEFHRGIAALARNPLIEKYLTELESQIRLLLAHKYIKETDARVSMQMHYEIIDAMMARDEALAMELITGHLAAFYSLQSSYPFMKSAGQQRNQTKKRRHA